VDFADRPVFSLVSRDFPTYDPDKCPFCKRGIPLNEEFVRRRGSRGVFRDLGPKGEGA